MTASSFCNIAVFWKILQINLAVLQESLVELFCPYLHAELQNSKW